MRPKLTLIGSALVIALCSAIALAQAPPAPPKPGPEVQKLKMFVGKWSSAGEMKPGLMGPGGKFSGMDNCEAVAGGFGVLCHSAMDMGAMGKGVEVGIYGYDADKKEYLYSAVGSDGSITLARGQVSGDTWTFTAEGKIGDKMMKQRYSIKWTSKDAYEFTFEAGENEGAMQKMMDGKEKRAATAAKPAGTKPSSE